MSALIPQAPTTLFRNPNVLNRKDNQYSSANPPNNRIYTASLSNKDQNYHCDTFSAKWNKSPS